MTSIRSGVRSLLQSMSIFRTREMEDARSLASLAMEVYSDRIGVDQDDQERLRVSPDDIVKLPIHRAINLWVAAGVPRAGFLAATLPMEDLHDNARAEHHRCAQRERGGHHPDHLGDPLADHNANRADGQRPCPDREPSSAPDARPRRSRGTATLADHADRVRGVITIGTLHLGAPLPFMSDVELGDAVRIAATLRPTMPASVLRDALDHLAAAVEGHRPPAAAGGLTAPDPYPTRSFGMAAPFDLGDVAVLALAGVITDDVFGWLRDAIVARAQQVAAVARPQPTHLSYALFARREIPGGSWTAGIETDTARAPADTTNCFEAIPHDGLMAAIEERIVDRKLLTLVRGMSRAGVMEHGMVTRREAGTPQGGVISPLLANVYLHRLDRQWQTQANGVLVRYADDLVVMCKNRRDAEDALAALTALLAGMGLEPKPAKTRVVHLTEGGESLDFLGFHHRWVRSPDPRSRHIAFLARWASRQAMQRARDRVRELTGRDRLRWPIEQIVQDLNRFLRGWAGYFRYGNSTAQFDQIIRHADNRLALLIAKRNQQPSRYGRQALASRPDRYGLISLNGTIAAPRPNRPWRPEAECRR